MVQKNILITGGTGYLGSKLIYKLIESNFKLIVLKREISSLKRLENCKNCIKFYNIEGADLDLIITANNILAIIHMSTNYGRENEDDIEVLTTNLILPLQLFEAAKKNSVQYFINTDTCLPPYINMYSTSKYYFQKILNFKSTDSLIMVINIRLEYFYGPDDIEWKLIPMILRKLKNNEKEIQFSEGTQKRSFIFIDDLIEAFMIIINNLNKMKTWNEFNVCSDENISIRDLAILCKRLMGNTKTELIFDKKNNRINEIDNIKCNNKELKEMGWEAKISLEQGLLYVKSYLEN